MTHKGTVSLEAEDIILRRFTIADMTGMYENCWRHPELTRWTSYAPMGCVEEVQTGADMFTEKWLGAYRRDNRYSWAIVEKGTGEVIGRMFGMHPDDEKCEVELAYELGPSWWNKGYMTQAVKTVLRFFFRDVGMKRVYAYHADQNPASGRVMRKAGMRYEGTTPRGCVCNGGVFDAVNYATTAEEYFQDETE